MRGVNRPEKEEVFKLLREGVTPVQIAKQLKLPLSTVTTWLKELREKKREFIQPSQPSVKAVLYAQRLITAGTEISNLISPYIICGITDDEWMQLEDDISGVLNRLILKDFTDEEKAEAVKDLGSEEN